MGEDFLTALRNTFKPTPSDAGNPPPLAEADYPPDPPETPRAFRAVVFVDVTAFSADGAREILAARLNRIGLGYDIDEVECDEEEESGW